MPDNTTLTDEMRTWLNNRMHPQHDFTLAADLHAFFELDDTKDGYSLSQALVKEWREESA